jgi:hypothetical protein
MPQRDNGVRVDRAARAAVETRPSDCALGASSRTDRGVEPRAATLRLHGRPRRYRASAQATSAGVTRRRRAGLPIVVGSTPSSENRPPATRRPSSPTPKNRGREPGRARAARGGGGGDRDLADRRPSSAADILARPRSTSSRLTRPHTLWRRGRPRMTRSAIRLLELTRTSAVVAAACLTGPT